jgi:DNA repair protein RecO (recombination protein O)
MRVSDKAIVLQANRYGDKKLILKLFSRNHGLLQTAVVVSNSPSAKIRPAAILPLNLVDIEIIKKQNEEIHRLTEASCYYISHAVPGSISRLSIAQFLNEILIKALKEQAPNANLFDFIEACIKFLNESDERHLNLHVYFLFELTKYLGIEPRNNYSLADNFFDCREGRFSQFNYSFPLGLDREDSAFFSEALKRNYLNDKLAGKQRQKLLEIMIAYYQMHIPGFSNLKSIEVLKEVVAA